MKILKNIGIFGLVGLSVVFGIFVLLLTFGTVGEWKICSIWDKVFWVFCVIALLVLWGITGILLERGRQATATMDGIEYEHYCARYLQGMGFRNVTITPASRDFGADIFAEDREGNHWVFQCKYYTGKVGNGAVQEVTAAKAHYGAERAAVITSSVLTTNARQLAQENGIVLYENII